MSIRQKLSAYVPLILLFAIGSGCRGASDTPQDGYVDPVVDITVRGLQYEAPDRVPSGWVTFRFHNESEMVHFGVLEKMPGSRGVREHQEEIAPVFQAGMDLIRAGDNDAAMSKFGELPEWYGDVVFAGGPGLTGSGRLSSTTVFLDPGTYVMECYVKTNGVFHSYNPDEFTYGMVHEFTVTESAADVEPPEPDVEIDLSSESGMSVSGDLHAGSNTIAVHFVDQTVHENFVGHDVHLARLSDDTDMDALSAWMDWSRPDGLQTPAPVEFLGGVEEMPAGGTGYFTVDVTPGRYAFISEVTAPNANGLLKTVTVE